MLHMFFVFEIKHVNGCGFLKSGLSGINRFMLRISKKNDLLFTNLLINQPLTARLASYFFH